VIILESFRKPSARVLLKKSKDKMGVTENKTIDLTRFGKQGFKKAMMIKDFVFRRPLSALSMNVNKVSIAVKF